MRCLRLTAPALALTACALAAASGCAGSAAPNRETALLETLEHIWDGYGGRAAWERVERVDVRLTVRGDPPSIEVPPQRLRFSRADPALLVVGDDGHEKAMLLSEPPDPATPDQASDYHLRAARVFFHLPLSLSQPGWELRQDVFADADVGEGVRGFWAVPEAVPSPHVGYFIVPDESGSRVRSVYYQVRHPRFAGKIFVAEFRRHREVNGILMPTEIVHRLVRDSSGKIEPGVVRPLDPFEPVRSAWDPGTLDGDDAEAFATPLLWIQIFDQITLE